MVDGHGLLRIEPRGASFPHVAGATIAIILDTLPMAFGVYHAVLDSASVFFSRLLATESHDQFVFL